MRVVRSGDPKVKDSPCKSTMSRDSKNFIRLNAKDALERSKLLREKNKTEMQSYKPEILGDLNETHTNFGNVPK